MSVQTRVLLTTSLALTIAPGCTLPTVNSCDIGVLYNNLDLIEQHNCDVCGDPAGCPNETGDDRDGPFLCIERDPGIGWALCVPSDDPSYASIVSDAWSGRDTFILESCDEATWWPAFWEPYPDGTTMLICNQETSYRATGGVALECGPYDMDSFGPCWIPASWGDEQMRTLDENRNGLRCGQDGHICALDYLRCTCECDSDADCQGTIGPGPHPEWVCEGGCVFSRVF